MARITVRPRAIFGDGRYRHGHGDQEYLHGRQTDSEAVGKKRDHERGQDGACPGRESADRALERRLFFGFSGDQLGDPSEFHRRSG